VLLPIPIVVKALRNSTILPSDRFALAQYVVKFVVMPAKEPVCARMAVLLSRWIEYKVAGEGRLDVEDGV